MEPKYAVYVLIDDLDIVYVGITTNIIVRRKQHTEVGKIKFDSLKVILHGLDKNSAELVESALIHFGSVDMGLRLRNKNHNPMYSVFNLQKEK